MFWNRSSKQEQPAKPEVEYLRPGECECGHIRSIHEGGKGKCHKGYPVSEEWPNGANCACQIYIRDDDDDNEETPETPTPSELEKLYQL